MKKKICALLTCCMLLTLAGCNKFPFANETSADPSETVTQTTAADTQSSQFPMAAVFIPTTTTEETNPDGTLIFSQSTQNISLTIQDPEVADKVILDFLNRIDTHNQSSQAILESAKANYNPEHWTPYLCHTLYNPTRIDQGVLSLFGDYVEYNGSMHASKTNISVSYDLTNGDVLTLAGILKIGASTESFPELVIAKLAEKAEELSLYTGYEDFVKQRFQRAPSQDEAFYFTPAGLCFYFAPYEIAPYATGTISVEIPYEQLVGILDDSYFPAESHETDGNIQIAPFNPDDMGQYSQIVEAIVSSDGMMLSAQADDTVYNVKITVKGPDGQSHDKVLFASQALSPGDALVIQATQDELLTMVITYENNAGTQEIHF